MKTLSIGVSLILALFSAAPEASEQITDSDVLRSLNADAAPVSDGRLLICPPGTSYHKGLCAGEPEWTGERPFADGISPQSYLQLVCPGARLLSVSANYLFPNNGRSFLAAKSFSPGGTLSMTKLPRSISITYVGRCKSD